MQVTDVRLRRVETDGRMRAIASITLDEEFVVHDIRVIDGNNGLFVACQVNVVLTVNSVISLTQLIPTLVQKFKK